MGFMSEFKVLISPTVQQYTGTKVSLLRSNNAGNVRTFCLNIISNSVCELA